MPETTASRRRVLMVHWDGAGNLPPQRALARELRRRGHEVHVLSHDSVAERVAADGAVFHRLETAAQYSAAIRLAPEAEMSAVIADVLLSPAFEADFMAAYDAVRPDVLAVDTMLFAVLKRCAGLPVPTVALYHTIYAPQFFDPIVAPYLQGTGDSAADTTAAGFLEAFAAVLVFSYEAFGLRESLPASVHHLGPIREATPSAPWPRRYSDRPLVLVSLSTSFQGQHATLQRICDALAGLPVEAIVTTGPNVEPADLRLGGAVDALQFTPHDEILPSADLLVTHAGHGTVMAGAGAGTPMLCMPMGRDQPMVSGRVEALGLGRTLSPDSTPDEIAAAVMAMLANPAARAASCDFAAGVRRFGDLTRAAEFVETA